MPYLQIVYRSVASGVLDEIQVGEFLKTVRGGDLRSRVSGMLLYRDGCCIQLIEGPREAVLQTFHRICQDTRHREITVLEERWSDWLVMPTWALVYVPADPSGVADPCAAGIDFVLDPEQARDICKLFPPTIGQPFLEMLPA